MGADDSNFSTQASFLAGGKNIKTSPNTLKALEFKTSGLCTLSYFEEGLKRGFSDTKHGSSLERLLWGEEISGFQFE
jgi:hypothetical protein